VKWRASRDRQVLAPKSLSLYSSLLDFLSRHFIFNLIVHLWGFLAFIPSSMGCINSTGSTLKPYPHFPRSLFHPCLSLHFKHGANPVYPYQTTIAMGHTVMHRNPVVFPDPLRFSPERWLQPDSPMLDRYLVAFSKGPRQCIGIK
jgi:hypothetical protein